MSSSGWLGARPGLLAGLGLALMLSGTAHVAVEAFLRHERDQAQQAAFAEAGRDAEAARLTLYRTLDAVDALGEVVQQRQALVDQSNPTGVQAMEELARQVVARRSFGILQVAMVGPDGRIAWSSLPGWQPIDLSDRPHVLAHRPGPDGSLPPDRLFISEPMVGRVSKLPTLQASRPLRGAYGQFAGISVISLDPLDLARLLRELLPDKRGVITVIRDDGIYLSRSRDPGSSIGHRLRPDTLIMQMMAAGREGDVRIRGSIGGRELITALRRLPDTQLYVAANLDAALVAQATQRMEALLRAGEIALALLSLGVVGLFHQRWQRRRNQRQLAAVEAVRREMSLVLEGLPGAAYRAELDAEGGFRFLYASSSITKLTGLRRSAAQDIPAWLARVEATDPPDALHGLHARAAREGRQTVDMLFRRPDETRRWLRITVQPVWRDPDGRIELVGYMSDVTEKREALSAMVNSAKLATLGEMATGLAHELNQPVTIMALAAENTARGLRRRGAAAIPDALQRMERIGMLAQRAKAIIDHLRAFGRTDPGALEPMSLAEALDGVGMLTGAALREAEIALVLDLAPGLPRIRGRLLLPEQVLINLVLNARDAILGAPGTGLGQRITVTARLAGEWVQVTVADTGPGIPEAVLPRLFEPFFTTKPTGQGTGLGLSLCHGIMRSLGGTISAGNGPEGAELRLLLQPEVVSSGKPQPTYAIES